jgi:broad specificity polyphosphatase/5'/3'-nucleotidase SurE
MFTSPEQSYAVSLRQDTQHQQPQALQTDWKSMRHTVQQHLPQQEIQKTGLSVQAPSASNNDKLKVATVVQQIMTEFSECMSKDKIIVITKMVLNKTIWLLEFIGHSKSEHLMQMTFEGSTTSSVNSLKTYI